MVPVLSILHHPRRLGSPITFPIRTHHGNRNVRPCMCHGRPASINFLTVEQNQRKTYREVLIAGDVSESDVTRAGDQFLESGVNRL